MNGDKQLDVREIDKRFRKKTILGLFNQLTDGQALELVSDHSLAPLKKLFEKEKQGFFEWKVLENGPSIWRNSIMKMESLNLTINEILKQFPLSVEILEKYGIAYYRYGGNKIGDVSDHAKDIFSEITQQAQPLVNPLRTDCWSIAFTIEYIINNHHAYINEAIPELQGLIDHLVIAHAATHPQLPMIRERFAEFTGELTDHLLDEEQIVFPAFSALESLGVGNATLTKELDHSINWMKEDHILTGTSLKTLRSFCNNYVAPADSSPGFKILFEELKKFEWDTHFHIHLENNVLFSKVVQALNDQKIPSN